MIYALASLSGDVESILAHLDEFKYPLPPGARAQQHHQNNTRTQCHFTLPPVRFIRATDHCWNRAPHFRHYCVPRGLTATIKSEVDYATGQTIPALHENTKKLKAIFAKIAGLEDPINFSKELLAP